MPDSSRKKSKGPDFRVYVGTSFHNTIFCEIEALDYLSQLLDGVERAETIAMADNLSHQQTPVPAEKDSAFILNDFCQLFIVVVIFIQAVESQHPQISSQPSKVVVEHKAQFPSKPIGDGMDLDSVTVPGDGVQRSFPTVD